MGRLDTLVTDYLIDRLLHPQRLTEILVSINVRRAERALELDKRVAALQTEVAEADDKLRRLYRMVEEGVTEIDEVLKGRLDQLKSGRGRRSSALFPAPPARRRSNPRRSRNSAASYGRMSPPARFPSARPISNRCSTGSRSTTASSASSATKRRWNRRLRVG